MPFVNWTNELLLKLRMGWKRSFLESLAVYPIADHPAGGKGHDAPWQRSIHVYRALMEPQKTQDENVSI